MMEITTTRAETSGIVGDIRTSEIFNKANSTKVAEEFLFELADLMKRYQVVKIDVCLDVWKLVQGKEHGK